MNLDDFLTALTAERAAELAHLRWENAILTKIRDAGWPLVVEFADRKFAPPETTTAH
jgi:hypothetical protein